MALEVHAVTLSSGTLTRVWDTERKGYRTEPMPVGRMLQELGQLALAGGLHPSTERTSALLRMITRAEARPRSEWMLGAELRTTERNVLIRSRLGYELARQLTDDLFDQDIETFLSVLTEDARRFLVKTLVLRELMRGSGKAFHTARDGRDPERDGYRDAAHALAIVAELRSRLTYVKIETKDTGQDGSCLIIFTLL